MKIKFRIYPVLLLLAGVILTTACTEESTDEVSSNDEQRFFDIYVASSYPDAEPLDNGLYFIEQTAGQGMVPDTNDWVLVNHVCYMIPEDYVYESYIENVADDNRLDLSGIAIYGPYKLLNGSRADGFTKGLTMMKEGGEATIFFTSELGYGTTGRGKIGANQSLKYEVELIEVIKDMDAYEQAKIEAFVDTIPGIDTIHDAGTGAIMYYVIDEATEGSPVEVDSIIEVAYLGYLTDGRVFDQSAEDAPFRFKVGDYTAETSPIIGWHLGLEKFKEGEKGRLIIPYPLAYGEDGRVDPSSGLRTIPPYETLVFNVEIVSVEASLDVEEPEP